MKSLVGVVVGFLIAAMIACGAPQKSASSSPPTSVDASAGPVPGGDNARRRADIDRLDQLITADMMVLKEQRPAPPPTACVANCQSQQMTLATAATAPEAPTCKPGKSDTCTQSCALKKSICENAGNICRIAAEIGGNDAYANEKCNSGAASCDAATKRCCNCL